jgi:hypothetical protein
MCLFSFPRGGVPKGWVYGSRLVFVSVRTNKRQHHHPSQWLWAGSGCGGSGRAPGWCGWAVSSLLWCCCGGAVCWRQAISLPGSQSLLVRWVNAWGCCGRRTRRGRPPDGASCSMRAGLQQCKSFVEMCIVSCLSASPACVCGRVA